MPEEVVQNATENPATTGTVAAQTGTTNVADNPPVDPRFAGKSPEELQGIIREQDRLIGRFGERLGKVDVLEQQLTGLQEFLTRAAQAPPETPPNKMEYDPLNPDRYIDEKLATERQKLIKEFQRVEAQKHAQDVQYNYNRGKFAAFSSDPDLFAGIENDVEQVMRGTAMSEKLHPSELADERRWKLAAKVIRLERGEDDKVIRRKSGAAVVSSERPGGARKTLEDDDVVLTQEELAQAREDGMDEKTATEIIRNEMARQRKRQAGWR